jgi:replicative DNA helicase
VWFIHHPARNPDAAPAQGGLECSLLIGKHRHGETGRVGLRWYPGETRFESPGIF